MNDYPFLECAETASRMIANGHTVYQKFTCGNCAQRLTIEEPNTFYKIGTCDKCRHITDIERSGCNYLLIINGG